MTFGAVKSGKLSFCSIECARHSGCEPTRMFLPGEQIGEVCVGCDAELDAEVTPEGCIDCGAPFNNANRTQSGKCDGCKR